MCATGTSNAIPPIPGLTELAASGHAVLATQLLRQPALLGNAKTVTIIGGGAVGCEVAQWLTVEHGIPQVSVIEMLPHMMQAPARQIAATYSIRSGDAMCGSSI